MVDAEFRKMKNLFVRVWLEGMNKNIFVLVKVGISTRSGGLVVKAMAYKKLSRHF